MYCIEEMIKHTKQRIRKKKLQEKALMQIYIVLKKALEQDCDRESMAGLMLEYEVYRNKLLLTQKLRYCRVTRKQKKEYLDYIHFFEQYVKWLLKK